MQLNYELEKNIHSFQQISEPHFHDGYEVLLCLADGGEFHIQENEYPLCRGMMFILPPKVTHRCIVDIASYERYILHFSSEVLWMLSSYQTDLNVLFDSCNYYAMLSEEDFEQLSGLMEGCREETAEFGRDLERNIIFMEIILKIGHVLKNDTPQTQPRPSKEFAKILPLIEYIHEHYRDELTLDTISQKFFISKYYLCHQFKELTGFSVGAYLINYRIRQACTLLRSGVSVQETGERVGFKNNAHFIRSFGQIIGVSPGRYVKSLRYN